MIITAVVNGFTGSSIWHALYAFLPTSQEYLAYGYSDFAARWVPILDVFESENVNFALEVHPTEIAFDIESAKPALESVKGHPRFGLNYDPSHLGYQGAITSNSSGNSQNAFIYVHMKDAWRDAAMAGLAYLADTPILAILPGIGICDQSGKETSTSRKSSSH